MVCAVCFDDEIRVWWDDYGRAKDGCRYQVFLNGKNCIYTKEVYYDFKNLEAGVEYAFCIQLVDENDCVLDTPQTAKFSTLPKKSRLDVTKAPYFAIGDGKTDNTQTIQRAFDNCSAKEYVYFPMGTYLCGAIKMRGEVKIRFDAGATLCNKKSANR